MFMTARSGAECGIPAGNSPQKCPEGCVKRGKAPHFRMAVKLACMSHLSYAQPLYPLTSLMSANKKSPILLEFRGTG